MKILVTGGNGFKGCILVPMLLSKGIKVISVDNNWFGKYLQDHPNLTQYVGDIRSPNEEWFKDVDSVIHLANIANDPSVELAPYLSWEVNVLSTQYLAVLAIKNGVKNFLFASSGSVYGVSDLPRVKENADLVPISEYNKTKMIAERVLMSYSKHMKIFCIRPATVCGVSPRMRLDVAVNILTYKALKDNLITVYGGKQIRPNIHINDICRCYVHFLKNSERLESGFYNAGFENLSILEIAEKIIKKIPTSKIKVENSNDPRSYRQCSSKLIETGFNPSNTVDDAIEDIIDAYKSNILNTDGTCFSVNHLKSILKN